MTVTLEEPTQLRHTVLLGEHERLGATLVDFHGWRMPLYYQGILDEHRCVRSAVGLFDVSHMGQVSVSGERACEFLNYLATTDVSALPMGQGQYALLLRTDGGMIDDVVIFRIGEDRFLVVVNAATRDGDVQWMLDQAAGRVTIDDMSAHRSIIAVQGPQAVQVVASTIVSTVGNLRRFGIQFVGGPWAPCWVSRSGYTGSDGCELFVPNGRVIDCWRALMKAGESLGIQPIGLGARDSLRLEAGLRLYGTDMTVETTPDEAGLGRLVDMGKGDFCGRAAIEARRARGAARRLVGLRMCARGPIPRAGCPIQAGEQVIGHVTSGSMSPLMDVAVAFGYIDTAHSALDHEVAIQIRHRAYAARVATLPAISLK